MVTILKQMISLVPLIFNLRWYGKTEILSMLIIHKKKRLYRITEIFSVEKSYHHYLNLLYKPSTIHILYAHIIPESACDIYCCKARSSFLRIFALTYFVNTAKTSSD